MRVCVQHVYPCVCATRISMCVQHVYPCVCVQHVYACVLCVCVCVQHVSPCVCASRIYVCACNMFMRVCVQHVYVCVCVQHVYACVCNTYIRVCVCVCVCVCNMFMRVCVCNTFYPCVVCGIHFDPFCSYTVRPICIYTPYMTVYLVISLPNISYILRISMFLANPRLPITCALCTTVTDSHQEPVSGQACNCPP